MTERRHPHIFVAVPLPDKMKSVLSESSQGLRKHWQFRKWVDPADYHITLQFLGGCPPEQVEAVKQQLSQAVLHIKPFIISIDRLGFFGQRRRPRILWAGISGDLPTLRRLQQNVVAVLEPLGFAKENRPYRPHITLAKKYQRNDFPFDRLESFQLTVDKETTWQVREIVLYQTHLGQSPMYEVLKRYLFSLS